MSTEPRPRSRWSELLEPDMITAIAAVVIGLCALVVSLVEVRIMRQEQRAAVWPRLQAGTGNPGGSFRIVVMNQGVGPAIIRSVEVGVDGEPQRTWHGVVRALLAREQPLINSVTSTIGDRIVRAGEMFEPIVLGPGPLADTVKALDNRISLTLCYCSVYDECWVLVQPDLGAPRSAKSITEVDACPADESREFQS